ncbi:MAG: hypothetical protein JWN55_2185, partial [Frankiales bacterium]|nr:hypothetical protein [Frankiales bacterium]
LVAQDAGVVHDRVERAVGVERLLHEAAGTVPVADVVGVGDGLTPGGWTGEVSYAAAPYGVGYLVATWLPADLIGV